MKELARVAFLALDADLVLTPVRHSRPPTDFNSRSGAGFYSPEDLVMGKIVEDEVIVSQSIDAIKLKSPRGLFRLSGGHEKHAEALEQARREALEAEHARDIAAKRGAGES